MTFNARGALVILLIGGLVGGTQTAAQSAGGRPTFEVASIKPNPADHARGRMGVMPGGRFEAVNATTMLLITYAYDLPADTFVDGAPDWVSTARLDVQAKSADPKATPGHLRLMLRSMLAERFGLVAREEQQPRPVYALVRARADGRLGPKLRPIDMNCDVFWADVQAGKAPMPAPPAPTGSVAPCLIRSAPRAGMIHSGGLTMASLVQILYPAAERLVVDKTNLAGYYAVELDYRPLAAPVDAADTLLLPSIFVALEEQLGLKLVTERALVPVVVIEKIDRPTAD